MLALVDGRRSVRAILNNVLRLLPAGKQASAEVELLLGAVRAHRFNLVVAEEA